MYVQPWDHPGREQQADERDENGRLHLPICPGYVTALPEVTEASHALAWKRDGELTQWCEGGIATPGLRAAMDILSVEYSRVEKWAYENPVKAGS